MKALMKPVILIGLVALGAYAADIYNWSETSKIIGFLVIMGLGIAQDFNDIRERLELMQSQLDDISASLPANYTHDEYP